MFIIYKCCLQVNDIVSKDPYHMACQLAGYIIHFDAAIFEVQTSHHILTLFIPPLHALGILNIPGLAVKLLQSDTRMQRLSVPLASTGSCIW